MVTKVNIVYSLYAMICDVGCSNWSKEKLSFQYEPIHKYVKSTYLNIWQRSPAKAIYCLACIYSMRGVGFLSAILRKEHLIPLYQHTVFPSVFTAKMFCHGLLDLFFILRIPWRNELLYVTGIHLFSLYYKEIYIINLFSIYNNSIIG